MGDRVQSNTQGCESFAEQPRRSRQIILHALDATANVATELSIYSLDTDVLALAIR